MQSNHDSKGIPAHKVEAVHPTSLGRARIPAELAVSYNSPFSPDNVFDAYWRRGAALRGISVAMSHPTQAPQIPRLSADSTDRVSRQLDAKQPNFRMRASQAVCFLIA
jgi:hypothetical protein